MARFFINYRTGDADQAAALVERELSRRVGPQHVFRASSSILAGHEFESAIIKAIRRSDAFVAVIGLHWLATRADGGRAVDDPADWPRREIAEAIEYEVLVVPLLVGGVPRLDPADLPENLKALAGLQYLRLDLRDVDAGIDRLVDRLVIAVPGFDGGRRAAPLPDRDQNAGGRNGTGQSVTNNFSAPVAAEHAIFGNRIG